MYETTTCCSRAYLGQHWNWLQQRDANPLPRPLEFSFWLFLLERGRTAIWIAGVTWCCLSFVGMGYLLFLLQYV